MINLTRDHWSCFPHRGFLDVCLRRWFRRIWIVQEVCLGRRIVFVCGRQSCSVEALEVANAFQMLASSVVHLEGARNPLHHPPAKWDREAMHDSHRSSVVMFRIFRVRAAALSPSGDARGQNMRRGLSYLVSRFNVDLMVQARGSGWDLRIPRTTSTPSRALFLPVILSLSNSQVTIDPLPRFSLGLPRAVWTVPLDLQLSTPCCSLARRPRNWRDSQHGYQTGRQISLFRTDTRPDVSPCSMQEADRASHIPSPKLTCLRLAS